MQAIQLLKQAHGKAKAAFQEIESASAAQRGAMWRKLRPELEAHEKMEEMHLYGPAAREAKADRALADWEQAHHREVQEAEGLIREISRLDPSDDKWLATVKKLHGALDQHKRRCRMRGVWTCSLRVRTTGVAVPRAHLAGLPDASCADAW